MKSEFWIVASLLLTAMVQASTNDTLAMEEDEEGSEDGDVDGEELLLGEVEGGSDQGTLLDEQEEEFGVNLEDNIVDTGRRRGETSKIIRSSLKHGKMKKVCISQNLYWIVLSFHLDVTSPSEQLPEYL